MRHTSLKVLGGLVRYLRMSRGRRRLSTDQGFGLSCATVGAPMAGFGWFVNFLPALSVGAALFGIGGILLIEGTHHRRRNFRHRGRRG